MKTCKNKIFAMICAAALLLAMPAWLSACFESGGGELTSGGEDTSAEAEPIVLVANGETKYTVIRPTDDYGELVKDAVTLLKEHISSLCGVGIPVSEDWVRDVSDIPDAACEILIGNTNRPESADAARGLSAEDYCIKVYPDSGRVAVVGGSDAATSAAVSCFIDNCLRLADGELSISGELCYLSRGNYDVTSLGINGHDISEYMIVLGDAADRDAQYAARLIIDAVAEKCGYILKTSENSSGYWMIYIGDDADGSCEPSESVRDDIYYGMGDASLLIGGNVVASARAFIAEYLENASGEVDITPRAASGEALPTVQYPADAAGVVGGTRVALADQQNSSVVVVDIEGGNDAPALWSFTPTEALGYNGAKMSNRIDECRLRYSMVLEKYLILFTSSSGYAAVGEYPGGECIFEVTLSGYGPHSIEYLPCGAVAVACSGNGNENYASIRFYAADEKGNIKKAAQSLELEGAHGVLWDDERELLWALGSKVIKAYEVVGSGRDAYLREVDIYGATLPGGGGHDIAAVYSDITNDSLIVGGNGIYFFDKRSGKFTEAPGNVSAKSVKCVGVLDDGRIVRTVASNVYAAHDTDRFTVFDASGKMLSENIFSSRGFYKARLFDARYS